MGSACSVVPAQNVSELGIVPRVALDGEYALMSGELSLAAFFLFLLVVSRIYEPMNFATANLAAMNSLQINIDRMNEINETLVQEGGSAFRQRLRHYL